MREIITNLIHMSMFIIAKFYNIEWLLNIILFIIWIGIILSMTLYIVGNNIMLKLLRKKSNSELNLRGLDCLLMFLFVIPLVIYGYIALGIALFLDAIILIIFIEKVINEKNIFNLRG
jgi:hypothetical protein